MLCMAGRASRNWPSSFCRVSYPLTGKHSINNRALDEIQSTLSAHLLFVDIFSNPHYVHYAGFIAHELYTSDFTVLNLQSVLCTYQDVRV